jgi:hypothetical protein
MKTATLKMHRAVSFEGSKAEWKIMKEDEVVDVDGVAFVQLANRNSSLSGLIGKPNKDFHCLTRSNGYQELLRLRNAEARRLWSDEETSGSTLFGPVASPSRSRTRDELNTQRQQHRCLTLKLSTDNGQHDVKLLRPVHPRDTMFVAFEETSISVVLHYIRTKGFSEQKRSRNSESLPKGVHKHAKGYLVMYTDAEGCTRRKLKHDLAAALAFHADPTIDDVDDEQGDDDDDEEPENEA